LRKHGLDPDRDLDCVSRVLGDHQTDLRRLRDGSIAAAYVGSTLSPEQVAEEGGFSALAWVGDYFQIPSGGGTADLARIPLDSPALQALVRANQRALRTIAEQPRLAVDYIAWFLGRLTRDEAQRHYERDIGPHFTPEGQVDLSIVQQAVDAVAAELGVASVSADPDLPAGPVKEMKSPGPGSRRSKSAVLNSHYVEACHRRPGSVSGRCVR
jgi:hypothetical protein